MNRSVRSERAWAKWRGLVEQQEASGLSVHRFCEERGIPASSLFAWRRKLRGGQAGIQTTPGLGSAQGPEMEPAAVLPERGTVSRDFVEALVRREPGGACSGIAVELGRGRRIVVERGFDRQVLLEVVAALEGPAAEPHAARRDLRS